MARSWPGPRRRRLGVALVVVATAVALVSGVRASTAEFGYGGVVVVPEDAGTSAIAVQPDGKIVVAAFRRGLFRLLPDGSVDTAFRRGAIRCPLFVCSDVKIQADGRIVVAGGAAVARLTPTGDLDATFGNRGVAQVSSPNADLVAVAIAPNGEIVAGGANTSRRTGVLVRLLATGAPDPGFGAGGVAPTPGLPVDLALQREGGIVVVARTDRAGAVFRAGADGSIDRGFGLDGVVHTGDVDPGALAIGPDGTIVLAGSTIGTRPQSAVARLLPNGELDPGFGREGTVTWEMPHSGSQYAVAAALQPEGQVVVAGVMRTGGLKGSAWFVRRLSATGEPAEAAYGPGFQDPNRDCWEEFPIALAAQTDGKVVVGGYSECPGLVLARYSPALVPDGSHARPPLAVKSLEAATVRAGRKTLTISARIGINGPARLRVVLQRGQRGPIGPALPLAPGSRFDCRGDRAAPPCGDPVVGSRTRVAAAVWGPRSVTIRLVFPRDAVARGRHFVIGVTARAADSRGDPARLSLPVVAA